MQPNQAGSIETRFVDASVSVHGVQVLGVIRRETMRLPLCVKRGGADCARAAMRKR